jgi:autotransporter-associated beta strand protein
VLSGAGGVTQSGAGLGSVLALRGINTYTGATSIRGLAHGAAPLDEAASIHLTGAAGSILLTSAIDVRAGGILRLDYADGHSAVNARVATATGITTAGGFLETFGNEGLVLQSLGTVNAGGLTTISAHTNGGGTPAAGGATQVTVANLQRATGGTVTFTGPNLGGTAVAAGLGAAQGNVILTQVDGGAPNAALVGGGGGAGTSNISILPWALGDTVNDANRHDAGSGFVTYGANGVRLLDPITEYNVSNDFNGLSDNFQNIRIANSVTNPTAPVTVNSIFIDASGLNIGGTNAITIGSGALAMNVDNHAITAPLFFGAGGAGEAVVSVVGSLLTPNTLTLSGQISAASLVKSGHGTLVLGDPTNVIAGGVTINGGQLSVDAIAALGGATSLTINSPSQSAAGAALAYTGGGADSLAIPLATNGGMAGFNVTNSSLDVSGAITGVGGVRKDGAGTLILSGANTYSGGTYLGGGTLDFDSDARLGAASSFLHTSGGTLSLSGAWSTSRPITIETGNTLVLAKGVNPVTISGSLDGTGPLQVTGSGTLTIASGDNGYAGAITLGSGVLPGGALVLAGPGSVNGASVVFGASGGPAGTYTLDLSGATGPGPTPWRGLSGLTTTGAFAQAHTVQLGSTALTPVDLRVSTGSFGGAAGVIQGFGKLVKTGPNALTLTGTLPNTFIGAVEVWAGTLSYAATGQLGNAANAIALQGGILNSNANGTTARAITLAPTPLPLIYGSTPLTTLGNGLGANSGTTRTYSGVISGAGGFNKSGAGTVQLAATNSYAGDTQVTAGILAFTDSAQLGSASSRIRIGNTGTLRLVAAPGGATNFPLNRNIFALSSTATVNIPAATPILNLGGQLMAASGAELLLSGAGKFTLTADQRSLFAPLHIAAGSTVSNLTLSGSGAIRRATLRIDGVDMTFNMSGLTRDVGAVQNLDFGSKLQLGANGQLTAGFNNQNMTWAGDIEGSGTASYFKTGTGTIAMTASTAAAQFTGGFHLLSGSGSTTTLTSNASFTAKTAITIGAWGSNANRGPLLHLNNAAGNTSVPVGRLTDTQSIFSNSGEFQLTTNGTTATSETVGSLRGAGMSTVTMTTGGTLNFADATNGLTRSNGGTFLFRAGNANMGAAVATTAIANLLFGNSGSLGLIGGGGGSGTTTISILPYGVGGITAASLGTNFVTYGANGIRVLNTTTEVANNVNLAALTGTTTDNVRLNNSALTTTTLGGGVDRTINALNLSGTANTTRLTSASTERLIVASGLVLNTVNNVYATTPASPFTGFPLGIQVAELQTGAGNTRELNVFATGGDLALGALVTTTGGLTKSGAGSLFLTNTTNTYGGTTTVNAGNLVIDDLAALGAGPTVAIGGGFLKYRGPDATLTKSIVASGGSAAGLGASAGFHVVSGTTLATGSGAVAGNGGILKDGTGVLVLSGSNTHTGATLIAAGQLAIDGPGALGGNGRVVFTDSAISGNGGQTLRFDAPLTLTQDFVVNSSNNGTGFGFDTNGNAVTLSGTMLDARNTSVRGLYKFGAGELNLTATQMYTGPTQVFGGTLRLSDANGSVMNSTGTGGFSNQGSILIGPGAALVLDNSATNNNNRLPDVWDTPFGTGNGASGGIAMNGGELRLIGHAAGTREHINRIEIASATITLSGGGTVLTSGQVVRGSASGSSAIFIRGTNLGALPGPTSTNWFVTDLGSGGVQLHGAGGAEGTPFINILRGGMGDTSATGSGTDLLTYAADTGFRTLTAGEYTSTIPANNFDLNRAPNVALAGAASIGQTTAITALKLGTGASLGGNGTALLAQSTVLATGNSTIDVPSFSTNLASAGPSAIFLTASSATTLTVNSILPGSALGKYGEGTLQLNGRLIGAGPVALKQGTLTLGASGALNPLATIAIDPGATFDLGGSDRVVGALVHDGATIGSFHLGQTSAGTVALGANRLTLYASPGSLFTGNITGTGGIEKALNSSNATFFTQPQSYTGSTVIRGGILTLAGAGTLASSSIELRGGSLGFQNADDNAVGGYLANRLGTSTPIYVSGGEINFSENPNAPGVHDLGTLTLGGEAAIFIGNVATAPSTVTVANVSRAAGRGTLSVGSTNLGLARSLTGGGRIFLTQIEGGAPASALIGGGGADGSTNVSILPWAWGYSTGGLVTHGTRGLRPLANSEYAATFGIATDNVRLASPVALVAPVTANALVSGASVTGAFDLTLTSGALALTSGSSQTIGDPAAQLLTGAGNTRELIVNAVNSGPIHSIDSAITTTGGVTKLGNGSIALTHSGNSFTGGLNIQAGSVSFSADAQLGAPGGAIRLGGKTTGSTASLRYDSATEAPLVFTRPIETTSYGDLGGPDSRRWQLKAPITGPGGIGYTNSPGLSVFELDAPNTYAGATRWDYGHLYVRGDSAFGSGGELLMGGGFVPNIVLRAPWVSSRLIHSTSAGGALQTNGYDATWSGQFIGSAEFTKNGLGTLNLTSAMPYSGTLLVNGGAVALRDRGSLAAHGGLLAIRRGAALILDDAGVHSSDRLHDSSGTLTLGGGAFTVLGSSTTTTEEVLNSLALGPGASTVTLHAGSGQAVIVRLSSSTTNGNEAASLWRGTNLGANAPGTTNSANFLFTASNTSSFPLVGGAAPAGHPSISIIAGGFGDTTATGSGTQLVTYDATRGVRLLDPATEYTGTLLDGTAVTDNVNADGSTFSLPNATTINALWLKDGGSVTGAGDLLLRSGTLLVTGAGNVVSKPLIAGSRVLAIGGPGDVTFTSGIPSANTGGLAKTGAGTLTLTAAGSYGGDTFLSDGVLAVSHPTALGTTGLLIQGGEIRNVSGGPLTLANSLQVSGPMKIGGTQALTFSGPVTLDSATREIQTTNTATTTIDGVVMNSHSLINLGLTKTGPGTLVLSNAANTYDGPTTIRAGVLSVGTLADGSVGSIVNPSGIGQSWPDADQLVFDGGTLRYTGPLTSTDRLFTLTPNGGTIDAQGTGNLTFSNTGAIDAPTGGARTLTLTGNNSTVNTMAVSLTDGPSLSDTTALTVSTTHWQLTNANTFTGATTIQSGTLEAAAAGALGSTASVTVNTGGTLLLSGTGNRVNNSAAINLAGGEIDTGGTSEGAATTIGLGALTLSASSTIDFTGAAATLTFASGAYTSGVLTINNWSGLANTAGIDGIHDRLIFAGDNTARLAFLGAFSQSDIAFTGFGSGYAALQFDANYFEVVPVPEPSALVAATALLGLIGWREGRRRRVARPFSPRSRTIAD